MQNVPFIFIMCSSFQLKCVCFGLLHGVVRNWSARLKMQKNYKDSRFSVAISFEWITNNFFLPIPSLLASCSPPRAACIWAGRGAGSAWLQMLHLAITWLESGKRKDYRRWFSVNQIRTKIVLRSGGGWNFWM